MNTMAMEGAPSRWEIAMATLQANKVYDTPPADTGLLCRTCLEIVPRDGYKIRPDGRRSSTECIACAQAERNSRKRKVRIDFGIKREGTLQQFCQERGLSYDTIYGRMRRGMTLEAALAHIPAKNKYTGGSRKR